MSFNEFQSTLVNVTPSYRIGGSQIGGVRMEKVGPSKLSIRLIITNDADMKFCCVWSLRKWRSCRHLCGPVLQTSTSLRLAFSSTKVQSAPIEIKADEIVIDLEGSDRKFKLMPDAESHSSY